MTSDSADSYVETAFAADGLKIIPVPELLAFKPPEWVVKHFIELASRGVLYGPSDIGKTFMCLDLALHIAAGHPWCGIKTRHAPVVYICAEGARSLGRRVQGWLTYYGIDPAAITANFHTIGTPVQLIREGQRQELLEEMRAKIPVAPALIVVDTLSWCILGLDENDSGAMTQLIGGAALLQRSISMAYGGAPEPAVLFVHHTGKTKKGMRGAYSLTAATDFVFSFEREKGSNYPKLKTERVKDGPKLEPLVFETVEVTLDMVDEDGQAITTCVCVPQRITGEPELGENEAKILAALEAAPEHRLTFGEIRGVTGFHQQIVTRSLKRLIEKCERVTRCNGGVYELVTPSLNSQSRGVTGLPHPLLSALSHSLPLSLERGDVTGRGVRGGNPKAITLGVPVKFATFDPSAFDHEAEDAA